MQTQNIACLDCGGGDSRSTRSTQAQIVAECLKCECPHLLDGGSVVLPRRLKRMIHGLVNQELE